MRFPRLSLLAPGLLAGCLLLAGCGGGGDHVSSSQRSDAITAARVAYESAKAMGIDLRLGPCIADPLPGLGGDWVADVAHDPRRPVDDEPTNQCAHFRSGQSHHFVELDPQGRLIRAQ